MHAITLVFTAIGLGTAALPSMGGTVAHRIDGDTLMVIDYSGKPPFERRVVNRGDSPAVFARYEQLAGEPTTGAVERRAGPPGKSLPAQRSRAIGDTEEVAVDSSRLWRAAPGKGRPAR